MPPRKTPKQIEGYLAYYDEQKASGSTKFVAETAKKAKVETRTVHNWVKKRNESPQKEDNIRSYTEIVAEKVLDKQSSVEYGGDTVMHPRTVDITKTMKEKFPNDWDRIYDANTAWAWDLTFKELEIELPAKDIEALRKGYKLIDVLNDKGNPPTKTDKINDYKQDIELNTLETRKMWAKYHLDDTKDTFEEKKEGSITQTKNENRLLDDEIMDFIKSFLQFKSTLPTLDRNNQIALINQFIREKALIIFPLIDNILYDSNNIHQEYKSPDDKFDELWASIPEGQRMEIYNLINGE